MLECLRCDKMIVSLIQFLTNGRLEAFQLKIVSPLKQLVHVNESELLKTLQHLKQVQNVRARCKKVC